MERITIFNRTTKSSGSVKIRFRLIDGRAVQLYHKSGIVADIEALNKFEPDGSLRKRITRYDPELKSKIELEMAAMAKAYANLCESMDKTHISGELFEQEIAKVQERHEVSVEPDKETMLERFSRFIEHGLRDNIFGERRMKNYLFVRNSLERFLKIKGIEKITPEEFTADMLMELREYFFDEYKYVTQKKYAKLFDNITSKRYLPKKRRDQNTVVGRMKKIQAFFNELLDKEEIEVSPFHKLGRNRRSMVMTEKYENEPLGLLKQEFLKIMETEVPSTLQTTKDAFLVQCAFGDRIGDFKEMTMDKINVSEDGIPYIRYLPKKTMRDNKSKTEIETPIMLYALEIIKKYQFQFPILRYPGGQNGYNVKIRKLLEYCGIDRKRRVFNKETQDNERHPIYTYGCSKMARATHLDLLKAMQIDLYKTGLHKRGSQAVHHYVASRLSDTFALMCAAYDQPLYKVDKNLNVIQEDNAKEEGKGE